MMALDEKSEDLQLEHECQVHISRQSIHQSKKHFTQNMCLLVPLQKKFQKITNIVRIHHPYRLNPVNLSRYVANAWMFCRCPELLAASCQATGV